MLNKECLKILVILERELFIAYKKNSAPSQKKGGLVSFFWIKNLPTFGLALVSR